jgi:hypothetical protein
VVGPLNLVDGCVLGIGLWHVQSLHKEAHGTILFSNKQTASLGIHADIMEGEVRDAASLKKRGEKLWGMMWNDQKVSLAGSWCVVGDG